jgi:hypothetical protein
MQAAMNTHLSQSIGAGDFEGQHGMSFAISSAPADIDISSAIADMDLSSAVADLDVSSAVADMDISSAIAGIDTSGAAPAMTGRDSGPNTSPAITEIASSRRMVIWRFTPQNPTDA